MSHAASRIHSSLPRIALASGVPLVALAVTVYFLYTRAYPGEGDVFAEVEGRWAWTGREGGCVSDWHRITFSPDHRVMMITNSKPYERADGAWDSVAVYDIVAHGPGWIRGAIRGETRLTPEGEPVVWDLVLRAPDRYAWHRTDWYRGGYTAAVRRCWDE